MNTDEARKKYADIIDLPHHQSSVRKRMSLYDRAAQFAPFAALTGYDEMVTEEARLTENEIELSDNMIELLNDTLSEIQISIENGAHPEAEVTYFKNDLYKSGGRYETIRRSVKRIDEIKGTLILYGSSDINDKRIPTIDISISKIVGITLKY